jgi:hypothetical protein
MLFIRMTNYISICNLVTVALDLNQHLEHSKFPGRFSFGWNLQLHPWLYIGLKVLKHFLITNSNVKRLVANIVGPSVCAMSETGCPSVLFPA